jgi:hypothetical protein
VSDSPVGPSARRIAQHIEVNGGTAYGVIDGDIHVFGDGGRIYLLTQQAIPCGPSVGVDPAALEDLRAWRSGSQHLAVRWLHAAHQLGAEGLAALFAADSASAGWLVVRAIHEPGSSPQALDHGQGPRQTTQDAAGTLLVVTSVDLWPLSHITWLLSNRMLFHTVPARVLLTGASDAPWPAIRASLARTQATTSSQRPARRLSVLARFRWP